MCQAVIYHHSSKSAAYSDHRKNQRTPSVIRRTARQLAAQAAEDVAAAGGKAKAADEAVEGTEPKDRACCQHTMFLPSKCRERETDWRPPAAVMKSTCV